MLIPGGARDGSNRLLCEVAPNPTPASFVGGLGVNASGLACMATDPAAGGDPYVNGFRATPAGAIRAVVGAGAVFSNGYWFTSDGRLSLTSSVPTLFSNGDAFFDAGELSVL